MLFNLYSLGLDSLRIWISLLLGSSCIGPMAMLRNILYVGDGLFFCPFAPLLYTSSVLLGALGSFFLPMYCFLPIKKRLLFKSKSY